MSANFTQAEYEEMWTRALENATFQPPSPTPAYDPLFAKAVVRRQWNKTEEAYSDLLEGRRRVGQILDWKYEAIILKLARDCRYTPDFDVWLPDGSLHFHEVKGPHVRDDARVKFRTAATLFPYHGWWWAQFKRGIWSIEQEPQALRPGVRA